MDSWHGFAGKEGQAEIDKVRYVSYLPSFVLGCMYFLFNNLTPAMEGSEWPTDFG